MMEITKTQFPKYVIRVMVIIDMRPMPPKAIEKVVYL
jgi:hypothetical protein